MNLYEIDREIEGCIDWETGEIIDVERLDALNMERDRKIENILCWIKNLKADAEALKAEKMSLAERQKTAENKAARLTEYVSSVLNGEKFSTAKVAASWRRSEAVVVDDANAIIDDYLTYKDPEPNKTKIKAAIKAGVDVAGCRIEERNNLTIK